MARHRCRRCAFLDEGVPLAASVALPGPARMHRAAILTDELDAGFSHWANLPHPPVLPDISPSRGRSAGRDDFANLRHCRTEHRRSRQLISPLEGEMAGRPQRGIARRAYSYLSGRWLSSARSVKRVNSAWKASLTVPVGPWRCLAMITSAVPLRLVHLSSHSSYSGRAGRRLHVLDVIFLAEHEQHDVGVLLDRARFAKVGELRALVVAAFHLTRELRERDDRHVQLLAERLQAGGDLGDFLHAVVARLPEPVISWI